MNDSVQRILPFITVALWDSSSMKSKFLLNTVWSEDKWFHSDFAVCESLFSNSRFWSWRIFSGKPNRSTSRYTCRGAQWLLCLSLIYSCWVCLWESGKMVNDNKNVLVTDRNRQNLSPDVRSRLTLVQRVKSSNIAEWPTAVRACIVYYSLKFSRQ